MNRCRDRGEDFNTTLTRFAIERLLYRLTQTAHASRFTLKGAMLFAIWMDKPHRPTIDVDLHVDGSPGEDTIRSIFVDLCNVDVEPDGLRFDPETIRIEEIREGNAYKGLRVRVTSHMGTARLPLQVDIGFGDVISPAPVEATLESLLDMPAPRLACYPPESVVSEKIEAMISLGAANSRMKDFYDVFIMCEQMNFDGAALTGSLQATLSRRQTSFSGEIPDMLLMKNAAAPVLQAQWSSFIQRIGEADAPTEFQYVAGRILEFIGPILNAIQAGELHAGHWKAGATWGE